MSVESGDGIRNWWYSSLLMLLYIGLFLLWAAAPSRLLFVVSSVVCAMLMGVGFGVARNRGYFVNRADASVHLLVVLDVLLEGFAGEFTRIWLGAAASGQISALHDNYNFLGCTAALAIAIGGHRYWRLAQRRARNTDPTGETKRPAAHRDPT